MYISIVTTPAVFGPSVCTPYQVKMRSYAGTLVYGVQVTMSSNGPVGPTMGFTGEEYNDGVSSNPVEPKEPTFPFFVVVSFFGLSFDSGLVSVFLFLSFRLNTKTASVSSSFCLEFSFAIPTLNPVIKMQINVSKIA